MNAKIVLEKSPALDWRAFCQQQSHRIVAVGGAPLTRRRIERLEEQLIEQLLRDDLPVNVRAAAFRAIIGLRDCTARDLAMFFDVEPQVVVQGLSLLEMPGRRMLQAAPVGALVGQSQTKAA